MTKRLGPPPVETLPDAAWGRIERGVWTQLDGETAPPRSRRVALWITAPIIALAACVAVWLAAGHPATPIANDEPARVVAGATPSAVSFGDAHVTLDANSSMVIAHDGGSALLEHGAAWFSIAPRGDRPAFEVHAGDAIVRVIGTRFRVARDGEHVEVAVDHGVVEVRFRGSQVTLHADQSWTSTKPTEIASAVAPSEPSIDPTPAPAPIPPTPIRPTPDPDLARYEALQKLEARQPDVAIKGYLELSKGSGKWAQVALFAAGRLAADHHDPRAKTFLSIYLSRFPSGANTADARELLTRVGAP